MSAPSRTPSTPTTGSRRTPGLRTVRMWAGGSPPAESRRLVPHRRGRRQGDGETNSVPVSGTTP
jgi:hypothetical protein